MIPLIQAELYQLRIRRAPLFWLIASVILSLFVIAIYYLQFWVTSGQQPDFGSLPSQPMVFIYQQLVQSTAIFLLIGLGNTAYNDESKHRTFINTVSVGHSRLSIYLAKLLSGLFMALAFVFTSALVITIVGSVLFYGDLEMYYQNIIVDLIWQNLPIWLMYLALFQIIYVFSTSNLWMNVTFVMLIALPLILELLRFQFDFVEQIEPYIFTQLNPGSPILLDDFNLTPWLALGYFLLFLVIGIYFFRRKEIK